MTKSKVSIRSTEDLAEWLEGKPKEFAQVIAMRVALRALPLAGLVFPIRTELGQRRVSKLAAPAFRATFISWVARTYPAREMNEAVTAASKAAVRAAEITSRAATDGAIDGAMYAAAKAADTTVGDDVVEAVEASFHSIGSSTPSFWDCIEFDALRLVDDFDGEPATVAAQLAGSAIWTTGQIPEWATGFWEQLRDALTQTDANWQHFFTWYQRRLHGLNGSFDVLPEMAEALDVRIATKPDEW